jgi:hypothetical protein
MFLMYEFCNLGYLSLLDDYPSHMHVTTYNFIKGTTPHHSGTYEGYLQLHMYQSPSELSLYIMA